MAMCPRDYIESTCQGKEEEEKGLTSIEKKERIDALITGLNEYLNRKPFLLQLENSIDNIMINRTTIRKQKFEEKQLY